MCIVLCCVVEKQRNEPIKRSENKILNNPASFPSAMLSLTKPLLAIIFFFFTVVVLSSVGFIYYNVVPVMNDEFVPSADQIEWLLSKSASMYPLPSFCLSLVLFHMNICIYTSTSRLFYFFLLNNHFPMFCLCYLLPTSANSTRLSVRSHFPYLSQLRHRRTKTSQRNQCGKGEPKVL